MQDTHISYMETQVRPVFRKSSHLFARGLLELSPTLEPHPTGTTFRSQLVNPKQLVTIPIIVSVSPRVYPRQNLSGKTVSLEGKVTWRSPSLAKHPECLLEATRVLVDTSQRSSGATGCLEFYFDGDEPAYQGEGRMQVVCVDNVQAPFTQ